MNLLLLEEPVEQLTITSGHAEYAHLVHVLKVKAGDSFDVGCIDGPRGKATLRTGEGSDVLEFQVVWGHPPPPLYPIQLLTPFARPQTSKKLLQGVASLGFQSLNLFQADKGEPSYRQSKLWTTHAWREQLIEGVQQAYSTWLPKVRWTAKSLEDVLRELPTASNRVALDLYETQDSLTAWEPLIAEGPVLFALGGERGWSARERTCLREAKFSFFHLGSRVLRTEQALSVGFGILGSKMGWLAEAGDAVMEPPPG